MMWYEKSYNENTGLWMVYRCTTMSYVAVASFKTEKSADNYIKLHQH